MPTALAAEETGSIALLQQSAQFPWMRERARSLPGLLRLAHCDSAPTDAVSGAGRRKRPGTLRPSSASAILVGDVAGELGDRAARMGCVASRRPAWRLSRVRPRGRLGYEPLSRFARVRISRDREHRALLQRIARHLG